MVRDSQYRPIATILLSASSEKATVKNHLPGGQVNWRCGGRMPTVAPNLSTAKFPGGPVTTAADSAEALASGHKALPLASPASPRGITLPAGGTRP